jgi:hypothetical protein
MLVAASGGPAHPAAVLSASGGYVVVRPGDVADLPGGTYAVGPVLSRDPAWT